MNIISNPTTVSLSGHAIPLECVEGRAIMTLLNGDQLDIGECTSPSSGASADEIAAAVAATLKNSTLFNDRLTVIDSTPKYNVEIGSGRRTRNGVDIYRTRGDDYPLEISVVDSEGSAIPLEGVSLTLSINGQSKPEDPDYHEQLTGVVIDATTGLISFDVSAVAVGTVGRFYYDIQVISSEGKKRTLTSGRCIIDQDVTK